MTTTSSSTPAVPALIRAHIRPASTDDFDLGILLKRSDDPHPASVVIYYILPGSYAAEETELSAGCEILAVNKHRVKGSPDKTLELIYHSLQKYGKVNLLCSDGERRSGSSYQVGKLSPSNKRGGAPQNYEGAHGTVLVDGMELEDRDDGRVRIVGNLNLPGSVARGLHLNKGDHLYAIDGRPIASVSDVREALAEAAARDHVMVSILTYNVFRRVRMAVMAMKVSSTLGKLSLEAKQEGGAKKKTSNIEDDYQMGVKLGEGAFAVVKKAKHKTTGKVYAIKIVNRSSLNSNMDNALKDEVAVLKALNHDNIYKLDDVVVTINNYYLVTEYLDGGELFDRVVAKESYTESEARDACKVVFSALEYMHSKGVAHRDLKPENLLMASKHDDTQIKIADFGFAKNVKQTPGGREIPSLKTMCGTPGYVAPEILRKERYGTQVDMFSMGVIVFILVAGYPPFYADTQKELLQMTRKGKVDFDPAFWKDISLGVQDLIRSMLLVDPKKRLSAKEAIAHPWTAEDTHQLKCMNLSKSQMKLKKYLARMRFKKAIHSILFVNNITSVNAVFSGANKQKNAKKLEHAVSMMPGIE